MHQTKPTFIIKRYKSILRAAIIVESVNYIVTLTDSIVAGSAVSAEAFTAIGLIAPFLTLSVFLASTVSTGAAVNYSYSVGRFDKRRADELFSQGMYTAILTGAVYAAVMFLLGGTVIKGLSPSAGITRYLSDYYYIILFIFFMNPITYTLDIMLIADGSERLSIIANISQIICNVSLSVVLAQHLGVKGVALATVISKVLYIVIACTHFFKKSCTVKLLPYWKTSDLIILIRSGAVKSSAYGMQALMVWISNQYAVMSFGGDALIILVAVEKLLELATLFMGVTMACQPLVCTLLGENNTKGLRELMKTVLRDMIIFGLAVSVIAAVGAPVIAGVFGISSGPLHDQTIAALRLICVTLVFQAVMTLFFAYYVFIDKQMPAFFVCLVTNLLSPLIMTLSLSALMGSQTGIWIGFLTAPAIAAAVCALIIRLRYGHDMFPLLIPGDEDIFIYSFRIDEHNAVELSAAVEQNLVEASVPPASAAIAGVIIEDMLMMICEKNSGSKTPLNAECTIIREADGVRIIIRDSGVIFDITDTDGSIDSFRQYIVSNLMLNQDRKLYMTTTGYNRNEFFFST